DHQVVSLQRAGKYQRPAWQPSQEQKGLDEKPYSQNIRTYLPVGGYAHPIVHTSACLPPYDRGYSPAIWTVKTSGERGWTGNTCWRLSREPSIRNCCCATSTW